VPGEKRKASSEASSAKNNVGWRLANPQLNKSNRRLIDE